MSENLKKNFFSSFLDKLKKVKHLDIILIVLFIAVILLIYFSSYVQSNEKIESEQESITYSQMTLHEYSKDLTDNLKSLISSISGAGNVNVMLYFEEGIKTEIAYIVEVKTLSDGTQVQTKSPVLLKDEDGNTKTVTLQEIMPNPVSVIVVASGAKDTKVKLEILRLIQAMFNLSTSKIEIFA
ncbi:MAG: hypothetical protein EOM55_03175 [Clostridia bacterium]|nr:hypothetical protein [Clostridia bacterium]